MKVTAYISAEIGLRPDIPTYSGGLGVLAGDHLKSAADLGLPLVAVTLLYRQGYFVQHLDPRGVQRAEYPSFDPKPLLFELPGSVSISLQGRTVVVHIWQHDVVGRHGHRVPVLFLDTDVPENHEEDRGITQRLYGGEKHHRLLQEAVLGFAGAKAIAELHPEVSRYHLNEGHCAFLPVALLKGGMSIDDVRKRCHFTTHTPVPAGHDTFDYPHAREVLRELVEGLEPNLEALGGPGELSMSHLALETCATANGVSELHGQVSREMFPNRDIKHITNGVHHLTWVSEPIAAVLDAQLQGWRENPRKLKEAKELDHEALWHAHQHRKRELLAFVNGQTQAGYSEDWLTIGFARRAATYKRASLLFHDPERLARICEGKVQLIFAGKAHPRDVPGQGMIQQIFAAAKDLRHRVRVCYIENYNMWTGALITSGVDVWLNNPIRPREASGTSGMKAALNGIPNLSIADGWWAEGAEHDRNGWVIETGEEADDARDANQLYALLESTVVPAYADRTRWISLMIQSIVTGAEFTSERMVQQYVTTFYS